MYSIKKEVKKEIGAYYDCFSTSFETFEEFADFLQERSEYSEWKSIKTSKIFVIDAKNDDDFLALFNIEDIKGVVNDTIVKTN